MTISPHVVYAGEDVTATTTAQTASCAAPGGTPGQSWTWQYVPGTVVSGCTTDSPTCVWKTGATGGWSQYCMSGAAWVGPWESCDYYGAVGGTATISVSVSPGSIKADGKSTATATATVSDGGTPETGDDVSFSSSDLGQSFGAVTDNGDGTYTATITASKTSGNATITATDATPEPAVNATTSLTSASDEPANSSATTLACSGAGSMDSCTATVTGNPTAGAPTGSVGVSATAGTFPQGVACSLAATGPSTASCMVSFAPPAAGSQGTLTLTAAYGGDDSYSISSGTRILCADGSDFELYEVSPVGRHDNGIELNHDAVLNGCGLAAGLTVRWGNDGAEETLSQSDIASGGASAQVVVPWEATSGDVSLSDGTTTSTVADNVVDSWRNTLALSFPNYADPNDPENFVEAFPGSRIAESVNDDLDTGESIIMLADGPEAFYLQHSYDEDHKIRNVGRCAGFAWVTAAMADGSLAFDRYGNAETPYGLTKTDELTTEIDTAWWKQFASVSQTNQISARADNAADLKDELLADFGSNGYFHPALVSFQWGILKTVNGERRIHVEGHEVTAFAVRDTPTTDDPGEYTIYAYDSNVPFDPSEDSDGTLHVNNQTASDIIVHSDGSWSAPTEGAIGQLKPGYRYLYAEPISLLEGPIQLGVGNGMAAESLGDGTNIDQASDPLTGKPVSLGLDDSGDLTFSADDDQYSSSSTSPSDAALTGVDQITGPVGDWRDTLTNASGAVSAFWRTSSTWASLTGTSGTDVATFTKAGSLGVSSSSGQHPSSHATIQVFANSAGLRTERVLTVTGALAEGGVSAQIKGDTAIVHAAHAGAFEVELSYDGSGTAASYDLGSVHLGKGQTLTASPGSWTGLGATNAKLAAAVGGKRLRTRNHLRAPAASVSSGSLKKRELQLRLRVPSALRAGAVNLVVSVRHAGHKVARVTGAITGHVGSRVIVKLRLPRTPPRRSTATITVTSLTDGAAPTSAVRVKHLTL